MQIAILGYGIVGGGVHALLRDGRLGIHVKRVLDIRRVEAIAPLLTDNIADIINDPDIHCVVETIGGMHPALSFVTAALRAGKHVVTSNKELISHALAPLAEGAAAHNCQVRFGASVGGGIPWIDNLTRQKRSDTILAIDGIVNGTTNFILDAMGRGEDFAAALAEAQRLGYAEVDASADLDGIDAQRKCAISASVAFNTVVEPAHVPAMGIANIRREDIDAFAGRGWACRLMMYASRHEKCLCAYVEPTLLCADSLAARTPTNHNCISMHTQHAGHLAFYGQGAGRFPTAQNIVQDLLDIDARIRYFTGDIVTLPVLNCEAKHRYYVRTASPLPADIAAIRVESLGGGILTQPVDVAAMHALSRQLREADPQAFVAGVQAEG